MPSRSGSAAASRARPGRDQGSNATRIARREHPGPKRADDPDVRGGEALGERLELAQQDGAGAGVRVPACRPCA